VSIRKEYPGQAYKVMNALWGQGLMSLAKVLVVVDDWVNVRNPQEAWWVALNNIDPERDARFTMEPMDVLDNSSRAFTNRGRSRNHGGSDDGKRGDGCVETCGGGVQAHCSIPQAEKYSAPRRIHVQPARVKSGKIFQ
jgi:hypothetical protein